MISENGDTVDLDAEPFTIWVVFLDVPDGTDLCKPIADDVAEVLGENLDLVMGMAEYPYNPERSLAVVPLSAHYLSNLADGEHRFNRAIWHQEFRKRRSSTLR